MQGDLFLEEKVRIAIARIQEFCPKEGYYFANSGGKDSGVVAHLVKVAGVKYDAHFSRTSVDPVEVLRFTRKHHPEVTFEGPEISMWALIVKKKFPPTRRIRYCCEYLKECHGDGRRVLTGIRWQESGHRSGRRMVEACLKRKGKSFLHPIIDWTTDEVWQYTYTRRLPYCSLYDEGFKRIGCVMCPMAGTRQKMREAARFPGFKKAYLRAFDKMLEARRASGLRTEGWESAELVMEWWLSL